MDKIKIAVLGLGTVGQGVVMMLAAQKEQLAKNAGVELELGRVLEKYLTKKRDVKLPAEMLTNRWEDILQDPEIEIIVETIGGVEPARSFIIQALRAGKSVVTGNKELLAVSGQELFQVAAETKRDLYFEGSVGGAIPVIGPLRRGLTASRLTQVVGVINSAANYILTVMEEEGCDFAKALQDAQDQGLTEADPAPDISGRDAASKASILATLAFHSQVNAADVYAEGIEKVSREDIAIAGALGYRIKLLALCRHDGDYIEARVHPALIPLSHPLSGVKHLYNAICIEGPELGETMFYGVGSGRMPSAGAILGDVVAAARDIRHHSQGRLSTAERRLIPIMPMEKVVSRYYLRLLLADEPGALAQVTEIFGRCDVSVARMHQTVQERGVAEVVFITHLALEGHMQAATSEIRRLGVTGKVLSLLRVEGF